MKNHFKEQRLVGYANSIKSVTNKRDHVESVIYFTNEKKSLRKSLNCTAQEKRSLLGVLAVVMYTNSFHFAFHFVYNIFILARWGEEFNS